MQHVHPPLWPISPTGSVRLRQHSELRRCPKSDVDPGARIFLMQSAAPVASGAGLVGTAKELEIG